jgi:putative ABC transport system substrate-binding protein
MQRLRELGWAEGRTVAVEFRWAEGRAERAQDIAAEFVRSKADVIVTSGTANVAAAKQATSEIPIVFAAAADPVGSGLVASLAHPGGNLTGLSLQLTDAAGKRLELVRELIPTLRRLAVLANTGNRATVPEMAELKRMADALGLEMMVPELSRSEDIAPAFDLIRGRAEALYVVNDPFVDTHRTRLNTFALAARLPTMYGSREHVEAGGLMSYGASFTDLFRRSADVVDKILRGAKPTDIPVEQPVKFDLSLNLTTAKALGITIPPMLLARADEVIE